VTLDTTHACVVDLDGVVWLSGAALPGAVEGVAALRARGVPVLFATNNSTPTIGDLLSSLAAIGIEADPEEVATSGQAAAMLLGAGRRACVVGEAGLREALAAGGVGLDEQRADAVVVGLDRAFDYDACDRAAALVRAGARFVATNADPTLPTPRGLRPGAGAVVAAIAAASGREPEVAGKPCAPMVRLVTERGAVGAVVGDRTSTDGAFAAALHVPFVLVASSVGEPPPTTGLRAETLLDAVDQLVG